MIRRIAKSLLRRMGPTPPSPGPQAPAAVPPAPAPVVDTATGMVHTEPDIEATVRADRVVLFMKGVPTAPQCGFSASVVGVLGRMGVVYTAVDVLAQPGVREGVKAFSSWPTIPQLFVEGTFIGGADIVAEMESDGSLATLLGVQPRPPVTQTSPEQVAGWLEAGAVRLLDVRTDAELSIASVPGAQPLRTDDFAQLEGLPKDTRLAFLCHHGIRSQHAAEAFRQIGFTNLHNVVGGIEAWSTDVDPSIPHY